VPAALEGQKAQEHLPVTSAECLISSQRPLAEYPMQAASLLLAGLLLAGSAPAVLWMELLPAQQQPACRPWWLAVAGMPDLTAVERPVPGFPVCLSLTLA
jgi:hypothetical protein